MRAVGGGPTLGPVMTFLVDAEWIGIRVTQMEQVTLATRLWQVPLSQPGYLGLLDTGAELVPVLRWSDSSAETAAERLVVILHVRGEAVGLTIERAGHLTNQYQLADTNPPIPASFAGLNPQHAYTPTERFWLIDTDTLWRNPPRALEDG